MFKLQSVRTMPRPSRAQKTRPARVLVTLASLFLTGCDRADYPTLFPNGPVALTERDLMLAAIGLMLIVVIPVFVMAIWFPIRYRASNRQSRYRPHWSYSPRAEIAIWLVPAIIVAAIGTLVWVYSHRLDPYRPHSADKDPLVVQAIALDWKWLFIYPEKNVATVNELVLPANRAVSMKLTSDTVMNAFFVPGLVSQIYAMAGMRTVLNFDTGGPATFTGRNVQFSGEGFPDQHFAVRVLDSDGFSGWLAQMHTASQKLDEARYAQLTKKGKSDAPQRFSAVPHDLFARLIARYHTAPIEIPAQENSR